LRSPGQVKLALVSLIIIRTNGPLPVAAGTVFFFCWYYPIGYFRNAEYTDTVHIRGFLMWLFMEVFFLFSATFAIAIVAGMDMAETAGNIANLMFSLCLIFCGCVLSLLHTRLSMLIPCLVCWSRMQLFLVSGSSCTASPHSRTLWKVSSLPLWPTHPSYAARKSTSASLPETVKPAVNIWLRTSDSQADICRTRAPRICAPSAYSTIPTLSCRHSRSTMRTGGGISACCSCTSSSTWLRRSVSTGSHEW
jgi:hypothetical protein